MRRNEPKREYIYTQDAFNEFYGRIAWPLKCKCGYVASGIQDSVKHLKSKDGHYLRLTARKELCRAN